MRLKNKVCVVTGGGSGIGAAICRAFAQEGALVAVADVDNAAAANMATSLEGAFAVTCDVSNSEAVERAFGEILNKYGQIDVLVNNAGILGNTEYKRALAVREIQLQELAETGRITTTEISAIHLTDDQWSRMLAIHLNGTFYCSRAALRAMRVRRSGAIINMSSINGIDGGQANAHYAAAKAGVLGFTRAVAKEAITEGIRVNAIAPGFTETPLRDAIPSAIQKAQVRATPIGRPGTAEEIAAAAVFLASDESSYFVGQTLSPNGGYLTR
ncbi:SDR family oxidoreductase [Caballeronia sp. J97]|uniref:SDR family oxidoreductase n=1 Tax=Caballeronia sp. J97 TaxID=2805429 RepID=UPI002AB12FD8|nr:SDR family oxidoreductase [Caballeronia sp. J97]